MGFFDDPRIEIVQVPHVFYNHDPMQANLALRKSMPDDQRFFFEGIMPSRDAWNAAFCCGSNSVTRRAALRCIGDALPITSITEDMLLSLALLRNGYITRYLCERLAYGLAPETLRAFFVQRQRWARGAMQILFQAAGPFGRNLTLMQRLLFLPTHWLSQSLMLLITVVAPDRVYVDGYTATGECDRGGNHLLPAADGAGGGWRNIGLCTAAIFSDRRTGAWCFSEFQDSADSTGDHRQAIWPRIQGHAKRCGCPGFQTNAAYSGSLQY